MTDVANDICDSFIDETIDIWINLHVRNLTDATYDTCDVWHMTYYIKKQSNKKNSSKLWISLCMECKFDYSQIKLLIFYYFSRKP